MKESALLVASDRRCPIKRIEESLAEESLAMLSHQGEARRNTAMAGF
jgi:hypothetical protein